VRTLLHDCPAGVSSFLHMGEGMTGLSWARALISMVSNCQD